MSKIDELIQDLCPNGVSFRPIGEVVLPKTNIKWREVASQSFKYIDLTSVDRFSHAINETQAIDSTSAPSRAQQIVRNGDVIFGTTRPTLMRFTSIDTTYDGQVCSTGFCVLRPDTNMIMTNFLFHLIGSADFMSFVERVQKGASYPSISDLEIKTYQIPIPPIEIQKEIVNILDKFTRLEAELSAELDARRIQYEYYQRQIFKADPKSRMMKLNKVCNKITTGKLNANAKDQDGLYPFFTCDAMPYKINTYAFDEEAILISGNGSQVGHINYYKGKFNAYQRTYVLSEFTDEIDVNYLLLYLNAYLRQYIHKHSKKGSVPYITLPMLQNFEIPLPNKVDQARIAKALGAFDKLMNDPAEGISAEIAARREQYEYYRTKLLTFQELGA